jgi:hypothetical protein
LWSFLRPPFQFCESETFIVVPSASRKAVDNRDDGDEEIWIAVTLLMIALIAALRCSSNQKDHQRPISWFSLVSSASDGCGALCFRDVSSELAIDVRIRPASFSPSVIGRTECDHPSALYSMKELDRFATCGGLRGDRIAMQGV